MNKHVAIILLGSVMAGCAAPSGTFVNSQGQQRTCSSFGFGWLGTPIALATYSDCVENLKRQGYSDVSEVAKANKVEPLTTPQSGSLRALRPVFLEGDNWVYRKTGIRTGRLTETVGKKRLVRNFFTYAIILTGGNIVIKDENLNLLEIHKEGEVVLENMPEAKIYDWPLQVGKSWTTSGIRRTKGQPDLNFDMEVTVESHGLIETELGKLEVFYLRAQGTNGGALAQEIWYSPKLRAPAKIVHYFIEGSVTSVIVGYKNVSKAGDQADAQKQNEQNEQNEQKQYHCRAMAKREVAPMKKLKPELVQKIFDLDEPPKMNADGTLDTTAAENNLVASCLGKTK